MNEPSTGAVAPQKVTYIKTNDPEELHRRIRALLLACCEREQACFACGAPMYFVRMRKSGKLNPYSAEGVSHFADCPNAARFRAGMAQANEGGSR